MKPAKLSYPNFDKKLSKEIIGKSVIVGYTHLKTTGKLDRQEQKYGIVFKSNEKEGVGIQLHNSNEIIWLPPDLRSWKKAQPGTYRLRSTGESIVNPDYLTTWIVNVYN